MRGINQIITRPVKSFAYSSPYIYSFNKSYNKPIPPIIIGAQGKVKTKKRWNLAHIVRSPISFLKNYVSFTYEILWSHDIIVIILVINYALPTNIILTQDVVLSRIIWRRG